MKLSDLGATAVRWAIESGLGPLLYRVAKADDDAITSPLWPLLRNADLTARMVTANQLEALSEILDACARRTLPLTFLKGISVSTQDYPEPHLRPMRDLDLLTDRSTLPAVEACLRSLGYRQQAHKPAVFYERHHHSMPFFHPEHSIWVEVHRGLFPPKSHVSNDWVFSPEHVQTQLRPSEFCGRPIRRLSRELQIIYTASHWASEFRVVGGVLAMVDMIYLLQHKQDCIDWERILTWLHHSVAASYVFVMLTYLNKYRLIDMSPEILHVLEGHQRPLKSMTLTILHTLIDRSFMAGEGAGQSFRLRNLEILWRTLLLPGSPRRNLLLLPWAILLPWSWRQKLFSFATAVSPRYSR